MSASIDVSQSKLTISRKELLAHLLLVSMVVVLAWLANGRGWDEQITALFFDANTGRFSFRESWLFKGLLHDIGKLVPVAVAVLLGVVLFRGRRPASRCHHWRIEALYVLLTLALSTGIAGYFKGVAPLYCPWSLAEYGGSMKHYTLLGWLSGAIPANAAIGHCWPSGHTAGAFGLIGGYFGLRGRRHRLALPALLVLAAWGVLCSAAQIIRGAHFLSHVLWSVAICWAVAVTLLPLLQWGHRSRVSKFASGTDASAISELIPVGVNSQK